MNTRKDINMHQIDSGTSMTIITIGFYVLAVITLQGFAAIAAILAGASTFLYNMYRFYRDYKNNQNKK